MSYFKPGDVVEVDDATSYIVEAETQRATVHFVHPVDSSGATKGIHVLYEDKGLITMFPHGETWPSRVLRKISPLELLAEAAE